VNGEERAYVDDVGRLAGGEAGDLGVVDVLDGVRATGVLSDASVLVVGLAGEGVVRDVLKDRTEADGACRQKRRSDVASTTRHAKQRTVDFRLLLGAKADALGVASSLNVENSSVGPDVLVVADELPRGVSRQSGLSGSGESEEERDVAVGSLVGGRVKREVAELDGLQVVLRERTRVSSSRMRRTTTTTQRLTMTEKIPFFISPAYSVPRMTISFLLKLTSTDV
jgi:hypothetical protein